LYSNSNYSLRNDLRASKQRRRGKRGKMKEKRRGTFTRRVSNVVPAAEESTAAEESIAFHVPVVQGATSMGLRQK
jgi:hypothetical protein